MSGIFSLIKESSIPSDIFSNTYSKERYVESSIQMLESVNGEVEKKTIALYEAIAVAEDAKSENESIKSFIAQIRNQLNDISTEIDYLNSKFAISLSNHCDSIKYQMDKYKISPEPSARYTDDYTTFTKKNMLSSITPRMRPHIVFEREFNFIAQLMQDLPITASNKDKLNVVATVCSKFNNIMNNDLRSNLYAELFGDKEASDVSFNTYISSLFKGETHQREITIDDYTDAVECISNCSDFIESINETVSDLQNDLNKILVDLNNILFCAEKNKFKVDTKEDGIRNTIYSVDVYTSNKIMWLAQEKVNQIVKIFNKYILALSIKMDCIMHYVEQSSDIINSFIIMKMSSDKCSNSDNVPETDDDITAEPEEPIDGEDEPEVGNFDTSSGKEVTEEEEPEVSSDDNLDDDYSSEFEDDSSADEEAPLEFEPVEDAEIKEAFMEFYVSLHEYYMSVHEANILESAVMLVEDGEQQDNNNSQQQSNNNTSSQGDSGDKLENTKKMIGKVAEQKESAWKSLIDRVIELWDKFKKNAIERSEQKIKYLDENVKYINRKPLDTPIEKMPVINHDNISKIQIPDLNYPVMKDNLESEEKFIKSQSMLSPFAPDDKEKSLSKKIVNSVIDPEKQIKNANEINPTEIYTNFCKKFISITDEVAKMTKTIEDGKKKAELIAKSAQTESATSIEDMYFNEFTAGKEAENAGDGTKRITTYFSVCSKVLTAKMTVCHKVFNEYNAYLVWHIKKMKEADGVKDDKKTDDQQQNTDNK